MTPIPAVITIDASSNVETALRRCISSGHTRLVVIENDNRTRSRRRPHNSLIRLYIARGVDRDHGRYGRHHLARLLFVEVEDAAEHPRLAGTSRLPTATG